ncbi:inactive protein RESTRICTED TEV MOVEMENT 2-like [Haliotis rufescens]|uniref:inactive protein RESTRICTED TEV MOVEMENT 2-like n=1 Tax=Haliotis rufescens TaxID=6454 RepID=UPI00201E913E|nr:inactive protein RESTRICTED TEV MOVEMENT 2-like [Haliotis rufescens]
MLPKVVLLVCLLPLAFGHGSSEEMGGDMGGMEGYMRGMGGDSGEKEKGMEEMFEKMKDYMGKGEEKEEHYAGDGDCKSKEEAEMKKYSMMKKFHEMQKMMEMKQKMEMKEKMEKFKKFHMMMEKMQKEKEKAAMEQKKNMYDLWQKHEAMKKKKAKENEFKELIESFQEQKHKFAFQLTHAFLQLCQCGEVNAQMNKMFMGLNTNNDTEMVGGMDDDMRGAMEAMETGNMGHLAEKIRKMSKEQQKKLFMGGLIKSMCGGAKTYVMHAKRFEETYMMSNRTMENTTMA